ncbi:MAG: hypothetical protein AAB393_02295, partial [Bacteroidota bacterium]
MPCSSSRFSSTAHFYKAPAESGTLDSAKRHPTSALILTDRGFRHDFRDLPLEALIVGWDQPVPTTF